MGLRGGGGWAGRSGAPAPGWTCLLLLLLCAALRSLLASPGSEGERGRAVGGGGRWWWCVCFCRAAAAGVCFWGACRGVSVRFGGFGGCGARPRCVQSWGWWWGDSGHKRVIGCPAWHGHCQASKLDFSPSLLPGLGTA